MGAGRMRFQRGPSLTKHCETNSSSTSSGAPASSALRSALAMALCSNFSMGPEARIWVKRSVWMASCTFCPRIKSMTKRAFCGDMRTCRAPACASINGVAGVCASAINLCLWRRCRSASCRCRARGTLERRFHGMSFKCACRRKFAELVSHHLLGDVHGDKFPPVVHRDGVADKFRHDGRTARPGLDHFLFAARVQTFHLFAQVPVYERTLFQ